MRSRSQSGVTLIELLVALMVSAAVMAGVVATVASQQQAYYNGHQMRSAQMSARSALLFMEQRIAMAGFGMDPALTFDFAWYGNPSGAAGAPGVEGFPAPLLCPAAMTNGCPRDATNNADEIVFYERNANYSWPIGGNPVGRAWQATSIAGDVLTLQARVNDRFPRGQILLAVCETDGNSYAYVTVATSVTTAAAGPLQVNLIPSATAPASPFRRQDVATSAAPPGVASGSCPLIRVFQIDRYRFHIRPVAVDNYGGTIVYTPYLMLDQGIDANGDGLVDEQDEFFVAEGIELIQFAYVFGAAAVPTAGDGVSAAPGTAITLTPEAVGAQGDVTPNRITTTVFPLAPPTQGRSIYNPSSWYPQSMSSALRQTNNQGNIAAVKISLVARAPDRDTQTNTTLSVVAPLALQFPLFNYAPAAGLPVWIYQNWNRGVPGDDAYQRLQIETSIPAPNMAVRGMIVN